MRIAWNIILACSLFNCHPMTGQILATSELMSTCSIPEFTEEFILNNKSHISSVAVIIEDKSLLNSRQISLIYILPKTADSVHTHYFSMDEHAPGDGLAHSNLHMIPVQCSVIKLQYPKGTKGTIVMLHVPSLSINLKQLIQKRSHCDSPAWIPQSVWRAGLPPPVKGRVTTPTRHCIIHHSASGNGDTNYTDLVRNYYTFHTTVNGWDDIGYNFLIAANGLIYAGRDPEKSGIRQDDVLGAHFCGKNSYTMGVCMIGDYSNDKPTAKAMASLQNLLGWKIALDSLNVYGSSPHPSSADQPLDIIAGHRNGCATQCPGDSLYTLLASIRNNLAHCMTFNGVSGNLHTQQPVLQTTENGWIIKYLKSGSTVWLYNNTGQNLNTIRKSDDDDCYVAVQNRGVYFLIILHPDGRLQTLKSTL